jgi:hypothetical protein
MMKAITTLYLPAGADELELLEALEWRAFAPRIDGQRLFRPLRSQRYAEQLAAAWNVAHSGEGYVLAFDVEETTLARYPEQVVGEAGQRELWVPTEDLSRFCRGIVGRIRVVATLRADNGKHA